MCRVSWQLYARSSGKCRDKNRRKLFELNCELLSRRGFFALGAASVAALRAESRKHIPVGVLLYAVQNELNADSTNCTPNGLSQRVGSPRDVLTEPRPSGREPLAYAVASREARDLQD
jgi:hypothetical protein